MTNDDRPEMTGPPNPAPPAPPTAPPSVPAPPAPPAPPQGQAPQPGGYAGPPLQAPMNPLALVAFIGSFFVSLVGIICGHIAMKQTKRDGTRGYGFALAGTIIGYVALAATIAWIVFAAVLVGVAAQQVNAVEERSTPQTEESTPGLPSEDEIGPNGSVGPASTELCALLDELSSTADFDPNDPATAQALAEDYRQLARLSTSSKAQVYDRMAELFSNPSADSMSGLTELSEDLNTAIMDDFMACS